MTPNHKGLFLNKKILIVVGLIIWSSITLSIIGVFIQIRSMKGDLADFISQVLGVLTTPFFMEGSLFLGGLWLVVMWNNWVRHQEGDEFVTVDSQELPPSVSSEKT